MALWMLVEDDEDIKDVMIAMFELWGVDYIHFPSGREAVDWIDAVDAGRVEDALPELAVLDIRLPGEIGGADVGGRLRQSQRLGNIGIVMITAYRLNPDQETQIMATSGADKLLYKPLPVVHELRDIFDEAIARRRAF